MSRTSVFSKKEKKRRRIFTIITILVAVPLLFPLYWIVISSLKGTRRFFSGFPAFFPQKLVWKTYVSQLLDPATFDCPAEQLHHRGGLHGSLYDPGGSLRLRPEPFPL